MGHSYCQVTPLHPEDLARVATVLGAYEGAEVDAAANTVSVPAPHGVATLGEVFRKLDQLDVELMDISLRKPSLDEVFLHLTGPTLTV
jgi:ABC-2 type transport system ATP-binding protein